MPVRNSVVACHKNMETTPVRPLITQLVNKWQHAAHRHNGHSEQGYIGQDGRNVD